MTYAAAFVLTGVVLVIIIWIIVDALITGVISFWPAGWISRQATPGAFWIFLLVCVGVAVFLGVNLISESDSNRHCNARGLILLEKAPARSDYAAASRRDISLTLAM
jgi:hypothetical protein